MVEAPPITGLSSTTRAVVDVPVDRPGRWIGGLLGVLVALAVAGLGLWLEDGSGGGGLVASENLLLLGLFGAPIGFVLGRAAFGSVRSSSWGEVVAIGIGVGVVAPPLGAIEILVLAGVEAALDVTRTGEPLGSLLMPLVLVVYAVPISFIAAIVTIPAGIVWAGTVRALPDRLLVAGRVPGPVARLGLRHVALVALVGLIAVLVLAATGMLPR